MEETERRTESITVRLISKEQFCKIMDAIHEQDKLMDSICKSLERIADIFSFDVDNKYRKALEDLLVYGVSCLPRGKQKGQSVLKPYLHADAVENDRLFARADDRCKRVSL
jgi:hypothetical protein